MANAVLEMRRLLIKPSLQTSGVIIEVLRNSTYRVRTASGSLEVKAAGGTAYVIDDEVLVRDGTIQGRIKSPASIPVYMV